MPFDAPMDCPACGEPHGIPVNYNTLGVHDCPHCKAPEVIEISWETEWLEPITEADR